MMKQEKASWLTDSQSNLKSSYDGPSQRQSSGTNQQIKVFRQSGHLVWGLTHCRAIKEELIALNSDLVYNQAYRLSHNIHVVSHSFITFNYLFKIITKIRLANNSF